MTIDEINFLAKQEKVGLLRSPKLVKNFSQEELKMQEQILLRAKWLLDEEEQIVLCMHFGFYYPVFNEDERTYKLTEIQKVLDNAGYNINAINEYRSARRHIADIMYKAGLVNKRNQYQSAKEDVGLKFNDADTTNELFDALNSLDGLDGDF